VITVTYEDVEKLHGMIYSNYTSLSDSAIVSRMKISKAERKRIEKEVKRVHGVFDQRTLLAGTGLLLKVMRQFSPVNESKGFYLVKNGEVDWVRFFVA